LLLLGQPLLGFMTLAGWTMSISAGLWYTMDSEALFAPIDDRSSMNSPTVHDAYHGLDLI
jgi:hypothetical protein